MTDQFTDPGTSSGINLAEMEGRLLLIKPVRVEHGVKTSLGDRDATVADIHVLDGDDQESYSEVFVWPRVLQGQLRANVGTGRYTLGRLGKGTPKPGQNAPWKLAEATDKDKTKARAFLAKAPAAPVAVADDDEPPF